MNDGLIYDTDESGYTILRELYLDGRDTPRFICILCMRTRGVDFNEPGVLPLFVDRLYDKGASFVHPNGDRVYETTARFEEEGVEFAVSITIHSRNADLTGATFAISDKALYIFRDFIAGE